MHAGLRAPRAAAIVSGAQLPPDADAGSVLEAKVEAVNAIAGTLRLGDLTPGDAGDRITPRMPVRDAARR